MKPISLIDFQLLGQKQPSKLIEAAKAAIDAFVDSGEDVAEIEEEDLCSVYKFGDKLDIQKAASCLRNRLNRIDCRDDKDRYGDIVVKQRGERLFLAHQEKIEPGRSRSRY